jgi:hypothetical protein
MSFLGKRIGFPGDFFIFPGKISGFPGKNLRNLGNITSFPGKNSGKMGKISLPARGFSSHCCNPSFQTIHINAAAYPAAFHTPRYPPLHWQLPL